MPRKQFEIVLDADGADMYVRLRMALKVLKHRFGLRCISICERPKRKSADTHDNTS